MANMSNYIDGEWLGRQRRAARHHRPVHRPPDLDQQRVHRRTTSTRAVQAARAAFRSLGADAAGRAHRRLPALPRPAEGARRGTGRDHRRGSRQAAVGSAHRSHDAWPTRSTSRCSRYARAHRREQPPRSPTATPCCATVRTACSRVFGPYNFPGHLPNGHIVPALIAGNTLVFKPSEYAPRTAVRTVQLWEQAGLPAGVLNLVNGGRDTGIALAPDPDIDGMLFTGSSQTGIALHKQFAGQPGKMLALEMGGNNPLVVWDVDDIDAAVHHAVMSAFISAGQRCTCARRLIVQDTPQGQAFIERLVEVAGKLAVGAVERRAAAVHGPGGLGRRRRAAWSGAGRCWRKGGKVLLRNAPAATRTPASSPPASSTSPACTGIPDEEWFGPLLQVIRVADFDAAHRGRQRHRIRPGRGAAVAVAKTLWKRFAVKAARRRRQLEPPDDRRGQLGAVRRRRQVGQPPPERLLRGRLLRLPGRLDRDRRTGNAGQAVARPALSEDDRHAQRPRIQFRRPGRARPTTTPACRSATSRPSTTSGAPPTRARPRCRAWPRCARWPRAASPRACCRRRRVPNFRLLRRLGFSGTDADVLAQRLARSAGDPGLRLLGLADVDRQRRHRQPVGRHRGRPRALHRRQPEQQAAPRRRARAGDAHAARHVRRTRTTSSCTTPLPSTPGLRRRRRGQPHALRRSHGAAGVEFFVYGRVEFDPSAPAPEEIPGAPDPGSLAGRRAPARPGRRAHRVRAAEPGRDRPGRVPQRRDRGRQRQRAVLPRAGLRRRSGHAGRAAPRAGRRRRRPARRCACRHAAPCRWPTRSPATCSTASCCRKPDGRMALVVPHECRENAAVSRYLRAAGRRAAARSTN